MKSKDKINWMKEKKKHDSQIKSQNRNFELGNFRHVKIIFPKLFDKIKKKV